MLRRGGGQARAAGLDNGGQRPRGRACRQRPVHVQVPPCLHNAAWIMRHAHAHAHTCVGRMGNRLFVVDKGHGRGCLCMLSARRPSLPSSGSACMAAHADVQQVPHAAHDVHAAAAAVPVTRTAKTHAGACKPCDPPVLRGLGAAAQLDPADRDLHSLALGPHINAVHVGEPCACAWRCMCMCMAWSGMSMQRCQPAGRSARQRGMRNALQRAGRPAGCQVSRSPDAVAGKALTTRGAGPVQR